MFLTLWFAIEFSYSNQIQWWMCWQSLLLLMMVTSTAPECGHPKYMSFIKYTLWHTHTHLNKLYYITIRIISYMLRLNLSLQNVCLLFVYYLFYPIYWTRRKYQFITQNESSMKQNLCEMKQKQTQKTCFLCN